MTKLQEYFGKPLNEMTPADWDKVDEIVANFRGEKANLNKVHRFKRMEQLARELVASGVAKGMESTPPQPGKMYARVSVQFPVLLSIFSHEMDPLRELFLLCDSLMADKGNFIRLDFMLDDVWEADFK